MKKVLIFLLLSLSIFTFLGCEDASPVKNVQSPQEEFEDEFEDEIQPIEDVVWQCESIKALYENGEVWDIAINTPRNLSNSPSGDLDDDIFVEQIKFNSFLVFSSGETVSAYNFSLIDEGKVQGKIKKILEDVGLYTDEIIRTDGQLYYEIINPNQINFNATSDFKISDGISALYSEKIYFNLTNGKLELIMSCQDLADINNNYNTEEIIERKMIFNKNESMSTKEIIDATRYSDKINLDRNLSFNSLLSRKMK